MSQPLLEVKDLSIEFVANGHITSAVKEISFEVFPGEITAIVGESGSGKSVTSLAIMRLLPDQAKLSGQVLLCNNGGATIDLLHFSEKNITAVRGKEISMIFQEPMTSLNPVFTCGFQVMEALQTHQQISVSQAREKTIELFERVNLPDPPAMLDRYPHQLSGGQKQRVMIAMAMSCNPSLLIADEPTTALDVTVQKTILELIKNLQVQTNMSVILITHDLGLVADMADKLIVMYKGEIVEQGQTGAVLNSPAHPYTKALLACRPAMHKKGERLPIVNDFLVDKLENLTDGGRIPDRSTSVSSVLFRKLPIVSETVLDVQHLKVYYPGQKKLWGESTPTFKAVDNVSFVVAKGETVGLVGESGCGKTTLGRAILQLIKPTEGRIFLNGIDLGGLSGAAMRLARKDLQIVFQDPYGSLNPRLTIGEAIQEPMKVHSMGNNNTARRDKVVELLEKVNLKAEHFFRYPHQFSGGQRQRICIARALALNPSFLIFDESVSALDVSVQAQVLNLLNDLKKEFGFTSIFISHDLSVVRFISDRIMVMNKGKIVEEGTADKIYFSPENEYTKKLIEAIPGKNIRLNG